MTKSKTAALVSVIFTCDVTDQGYDEPFVAGETYDLDAKTAKKFINRNCARLAPETVEEK